MFWVQCEGFYHLKAALSVESTFLADANERKNQKAFRKPFLRINVTLKWLHVKPPYCARGPVKATLGASRTSLRQCIHSCALKLSSICFRIRNLNLCLMHFLWRIVGDNQCISEQKRLRDADSCMSRIQRKFDSDKLK